MTITLEDSVYLPISGMVKRYSQSKSCIYKILSEMTEHRKRYGEGMFLNEYGDKLVNTLMYEDFLLYRGQLKNKNLAKHIPPYNAAEVRKRRGEYKIWME